MNAQQLHDRLIRIELSSRAAPDCRRVLGSERQVLGIALESGDAERIRATAAEAARVLEMWRASTGEP